MKLKSSLFLLLALPFVSVAETTLYYVDALSPTSVTTYEWKTGDFSDDEALRITASRLSARYVSTSFVFSFSPRQLSAVIVTNLVTGFSATQSSNPYRLLYIERVNKVTSFAVTNNLTSYLMPLKTDFVNGTTVYVDNFDPLAYIDYFMMSIPFEQRTRLLSILLDIKNDVSSLLPLVESNKNINAVIASDVHIAVTNANLQRSVILSDLEHILDNTVDYDIPQIRDDVRAIISTSPSVAIGDNTELVKEYFRLSGKNYDGLINIPITQFMVENGLASNHSDANSKLHSNYWRTSFLGPAISVQRQKQDLIAKLNDFGIQPPPGGFSNMNLGDLQTLYEYSYNTPASSNATLNAKSLEYLKHLNDNSDDINSGVQSLRDTLQGPQEVIVMNWPTDIYGGANLSNLFADAIQGFQAAWTNFNPVYTWSDGPFFERSFYNWRGLNTLEFSGHGNPDQLEIGISSFSFSPTGNFFNDVPNLIALQGRVSMDVANMVGLVAAYTQTNLAAMSSTQSLENQYQEEFLQQATESLNEFSHSLSYSNLLERNTRFIDTSSVFSTPAGFTEIFSGDHSIPSHINLQLPSWHFGQDDQSTPDTGSTITIETAQYATFFQNCRYVFLFLYWGITVMIMIWLFRLFSRFISWIPLSLTGGGSHDTVSI